MAGPSIVVRVLGDLKGLSSSVNDAGKTAEGAASRMHSAFSSVLGTLNKTGLLGPFGESIDAIDEALGKVAEHGKTIGGVMLGVGGTLVGVGMGLQALGSKDQAAHQQLQAAVEATGKSYDDYEKKIEAAIRGQEKYGYTANQTQDALRALTQATHDPQKALDMLGTAANVAAAKHEDLGTAASQVGKVYNGNTKLLKEYGIAIDKTTGKTADGKTATKALAEVTAGQAAAAADTFMGKLNGIKAHVEDVAASFGQKYGPAITAAGAGVTLLGGAIEGASAVMGAFKTAQEASTVATEAQTAAEVAADTAALPLIATIGLIVLAIAALIAIGYVIYRNWGTIWGGIKAAVEAVWNWIKTNWPLILGFLLGPIALAAALIYKYWDQIKAGAAAALNWLRTNWPLILAILTGPIGIAVLAIARNWDAIKNGALAAVNWIKGVWNGIVDFFAGMPRRIADVAYGMWNGIYDAFKAVVNGIIDIWNGLHFTLPKIDAGPIHIGGETVGVPHIPHLAQGGLITRDGLIYAHAGEAVTPAGRTGPAVNIEHASFSEGLDVEAFMRRVAWTLQTERI
jgi:hypothetical protein